MNGTAMDACIKWLLPAPNSCGAVKRSIIRNQLNTAAIDSGYWAANRGNGRANCPQDNLVNPSSLLLGYTNAAASPQFGNHCLEIVQAVDTLGRILHIVRQIGREWELKIEIILSEFDA